MFHQTYHKGREWDYAFDVDVADGQPMLKLCMNAGDNPYLVAERFLIENNLPNTYLDQVLWNITTSLAVFEVILAVSLFADHVHQFMK